MFQLDAGVKFQHVPYTGSAPALNDLVGGQVDIMFDNLGVSLALVRGQEAPAAGGREHATHEGAAGRADHRRDACRASSSEAFFSVVAPPKTPMAIVNKINADINEALRQPEVLARLAKLSAEVVGGTQEETAAYFRAEVIRWQKVIKAANVKLHVKRGMAASRAMTSAARQWPAEGVARVPYWVYSDRDLFEDEQARVFRGPTWNFLCLDAELPKPNTYRTSAVGAMPVVVTRDNDGKLNAFENRCAHRGSLLCINERGEARDIVCVYHNWSYDLAGNLTAVAFRKGMGGKGGMPADARPDENPPRKLKVEMLCGLVFGTLDANAPPLETYLGPEIVKGIRRVMRAPVRVLGGYSQMLASNWKLYMENVKD